MRDYTWALHTDLYQLTMSAVYHAQKMNGQATFSLFAHTLPPTRNFMVVAGLDEALDYLENFRFTSDDLAYLASLQRFQPDFLEVMAQTRFTGEVWALPEGTCCAAGTPLVEVTAPIIEAQLVETALLNTINLHTTLTSKAVRCSLASQGRPLMEFGLRRTQGRDAGMGAARAAGIAGFMGTSNVAAAKHYNMNPVGTMAHSFVVAFGDELASFRAFAQTFPKNTMVLVDTYDNTMGMKHAIALAKELRCQGHELVGVRLDSGDLAVLSRQARAMLNEAGLENVSVVGSGSLDEYRLTQLLQEGAQIDIFAVGTKVSSSADAPYLDLVYKMVNYEQRPTLKLSAGKKIWPGAKQIWRQMDNDGRIKGHFLGLREEKHEGQPLLTKVMEQGKRLGPRKSWPEAREVLLNELKIMPLQSLSLEESAPLPLEISPGLRVLRQEVQDSILQAAG